LAHLGLGRAYALSGDSAIAKASYQDFLTVLPENPVQPMAESYRQRIEDSTSLRLA
jgi:hypothetical protein